MTLDLDHDLPAVPIHERLGIEMTHVTASLVVGRLPVAGNTQPDGLLHGGASLVLAESLGSFGAYLAAPGGSQVVGVEINATHHKAVRSGWVTGRAVPLRTGRTTSSWSIEITDDTGDRVCSARLLCLVRPSEQGGS